MDQNHVVVINCVNKREMSNSGNSNKFNICMLVHKNVFSAAHFKITKYFSCKIQIIGKQEMMWLLTSAKTNIYSLFSKLRKFGRISFFILLDKRIIFYAFKM